MTAPATLYRIGALWPNVFNGGLRAILIDLQTIVNHENAGTALFRTYLKIA
jgi:hypothetical protein